MFEAVSKPLYMIRAYSEIEVASLLSWHNGPNITILITPKDPTDGSELPAIAFGFIIDRHLQANISPAM